MKYPPIIGVSGRSKSGKTTIGEWLQKLDEEKLFLQSFAFPLKKQIASAMQWSFKHLDGQTEEGRKWREEYINPKSGLTPRQTLQEFGTECKRIFGEDYWLDLLMDRIKSYGDNSSHIITDVRFKNEEEAILRQGGIIFILKRKEDDFEAKHDDHVSEASFWHILENKEYQDRVFVIDNTGDILTAKKQIMEVLLKFSNKNFLDGIKW